MAFEVARARRVLDAGHAAGRLPRWPGPLGRGRLLGRGQAALDAVAGRGFDPLYGAPRPRPVRVAVRLTAVLRGSIAANGPR